MLILILMKHICLRAKSCNTVTTAALRGSSSEVSTDLLKWQRWWLQGWWYLYRAIQQMRPETSKAREPYVAVLVRGKFRLLCVAVRRWRRVVVADSGSHSDDRYSGDQTEIEPGLDGRGCANCLARVRWCFLGSLKVIRTFYTESQKWTTNWRR